MSNEFHKIIIPGEFLTDTTFSFVEFEKVVVEIPKEFLSAAYGYGQYYASYYGQ